MRKKIFFIVVLLLGLMFAISNKVMADSTNISQSDFDNAKENEGVSIKGITYEKIEDEENYKYIIKSGDYILEDDIYLNDGLVYISSDVTLDLNDKYITASEDMYAINVINGNLNIKGNGIVGNVYIQDSNVMIDGGSYTAQIRIDKSNVIINGGEFKGYAYCSLSTLTINNGTFIPESYDSIYLYDGSTLIINDGYFYSNNRAPIWCSKEPPYDEYEGEFINNKEVTINGGRFEGRILGLFFKDIDFLKITDGTFIGRAGIVLSNVENIALSGGKYMAIGDNTYGGICINSEDKESYTKYLENGYSYYPELNIKKKEVKEQEIQDFITLGSQDKITVVNNETDIEEIEGFFGTTEEKNTNETKQDRKKIYIPTIIILILLVVAIILFYRRKHK